MRREDLLRVIREEQIRPRYQPIINLKNGEIYGYEALAKIDPNPGGVSNEELFTTAIRESLIYDLEMLCRRRALMGAKAFGVTDRKLFINVIPSLLEDKQYQRGLANVVVKDTGFPIDNIVLEMTERATTTYERSFKDIVDGFRAEGFKIALDDLGAGQAGLRLMVELEPDIVKLDRFLITDIHKSYVKKMLLSSVLGLSRSMGVLVIAEGIEKMEDLETIHALGVDLGQGYSLGAPSHNPLIVPSPVVRKLSERPKSLGLSPFPGQDFLCSTLAAQPPILSIEDTASRALGEFEAGPSLSALPVLHHGSVAGLVLRREFYLGLSRQLAREAYLQRPVHQLMQADVLRVDAFDDLARATEKILARDPATVYDPFVIEHEGRYIGLGQVGDVLSRMAQLHVSLSIAANPLTGLPGAMAIHQEMEKRLALSRDFAVCYLDLDGLKPFNARFGLKAGDEVIALLARILLEKAQLGDFIGHAGGDDFLLICPSERAEGLLRQVAEEFNQRVRHSYSSEIWRQGWIETTGRNGRRRRHGLLALSAACLLGGKERFASIVEIVNAGAEIMEMAKARPGTVLVLDAGEAEPRWIHVIHEGAGSGLEFARTEEDLYQREG